MHLNLDPTISKVVLIALLLFFEGIAIPSYTVITQGRWPTMLEFTGFILSAFIQLLTFLVTFLKTGEAPTAPPPPSTATGTHTARPRPYRMKGLRRLIWLHFQR